MSTYNNYRFTPGNKANMRQSLHNQRLAHESNETLNSEIKLISELDMCECLKFRANNLKQGWNDPTQSENIRISQVINNSLGGKTMFGNFNTPRVVFLNGGAEGQPGGMPRPIKNKF